MRLSLSLSPTDTSDYVCLKAPLPPMEEMGDARILESKMSHGQRHITIFVCWSLGIQEQRVSLAT